MRHNKMLTLAIVQDQEKVLVHHDKNFNFLRDLLSHIIVAPQS